MMAILIKHKANWYFSLVICIIYLIHAVIFKMPVVGALNVLLLAVSYYCIIQVSFYRELDTKKWATFSLILLLTIFFFTGVLSYVFQQIGLSISDGEKLLGESVLLLVCAVICFYRKNLQNYFQFKFHFIPTQVILFSLVFSAYILSISRENSLPLFSDERLYCLTIVSYIFFSIGWWVILTLSGILINSLINNRWIAIFSITFFLIGFASIPCIGWSIIGYFLILSLVTILKRNFLYMYIGGILLSTIEIFFMK